MIMPNPLPNIQLFQVGYCTAPQIISRRDGNLSKTRFPAGAALIRHHTLGNVLFDSGYGRAFWQATQGLPERFYRWLTPAYLPHGQGLHEKLKLAPDLVFLSHLHADHVAGLFDLPQLPRVLASATAIEGLKLGRFASLKAGCPKGLRDRLRVLPIEPIDALPQIDPLLKGFSRGYDLAGDGQMIAMSLPGHGIGQMGIFLPNAILHGVSGPVFMLADAIWSLAALQANAPPPQITLRKLGDAPAYLKGFAALRALHLARPDIRMIASHCPRSYPKDGP